MCRRANDEPEYVQPTTISTLVVVQDYVRLYVPAATDLNALVICGYGASQANLMEFMTQCRPDADSEAATFTGRADRRRRGRMEPPGPGVTPTGSFSGAFVFPST